MASHVQPGGIKYYSEVNQASYYDYFKEIGILHLNKRDVENNIPNNIDIHVHGLSCEVSQDLSLVQYQFNKKLFDTVTEFVLVNTEHNTSCDTFVVISKYLLVESTQYVLKRFKNLEKLHIKTYLE